MPVFLYLTVTTVDLVVSVLQFCMLIRAIFSFLPMEENAFTAILIFITEPVILPVRRICERFGIGDGLPIDIPFFITAILLIFISAII